MLEKIREFFRNLFKSNNQQYIEAPKESDAQEEKVNFKSQIIVNNEEEQKALKLQRDFKDGLIEEENLSEEDFNLLTNLYERQIEKTKQSIQEYKDRIVSIKSRLGQNS